ncbi:PRC-barrel domain-containing protein [Streptomyces sp. NPDC049555]|uniref:PRC-barrel domain-containing protein n=1 Tax=Streptomyces sp. NPDC049555 TaxID=3154930 RepID=UPI003429EBE9
MRAPLMLASELSGRPVVTLGGDVLAQIKDTVFDVPAGRIVGFTLSGRGVLAGPLKESLPWPGVHALGRHAVMVTGKQALAGPKAVVTPGDAARGAVLGVKVLTDAGMEVGSVKDVVVESGTSGRVAGLRITAADSADGRRRDVFVPHDQVLSLSGHALVVPADARRLVAEELPSFTSQAEVFLTREASSW